MSRLFNSQELPFPKHPQSDQDTCFLVRGVSLKSMFRHTRAVVAAAAYAFISDKKVAGIYDHATGHDLEIAAEARGEHVQGFDASRSAKFGGQLPELYDAGDAAYISLEIDGSAARGYDRHSESHYALTVTEQVVQLYDYTSNAWFAFSVQHA